VADTKALIGRTVSHYRILKSAEPAVHKDADTYFAKLDTFAEKQAKAFEDGLPSTHGI